VADRDVPTAPRGTGTLAFAAALLVIAGVLKIIDAVWAFQYDDDISEEAQSLLFENDPSAWGWLWLAVGTLLILAGFSVASGAQWARWVGTIAGAIACVVGYLWIFVEPFRGMVIVGLGVIVVYALVIYGGPRDEWPRA
jgi:hypothetical protein